MKEIRTIISKLPEVSEGTSCKKIAFKVKAKNFVFVEELEDGLHVMLKLKNSLSEAQALAKKTPSNFKAGLNGWVNATFTKKVKAPKGLLKKWIEESFCLMAPKKVLEQFTSSPTQAKAAKKVTKKKVKKSKVTTKKTKKKTSKKKKKTSKKR